MIRFSLVILMTTVVSTSGGASEVSVTLDRVGGAIHNGELIANAGPVKFYFRISNLSNHDFSGFSNGFRIYSPDGATWQPGIAHVEMVCPFHPPCYEDTTWYGSYLEEGMPENLRWVATVSTPGLFDELYLSSRSVDGQGADTIDFAGWTSSSYGSGFYSGLVLDPAFSIQVQHIPSSSKGKTICIDSSWYGSYGTWLWANDTTLPPTWDGPHCWSILDDSVSTMGHISLEPVKAFPDGTIPTETAILFKLRISNFSDFYAINAENGFQVYSTDGAEWVPGVWENETDGASDSVRYADFLKLPGTTQWVDNGPYVIYGGGSFVTLQSDDGRGADTIVFGGEACSETNCGAGLFPGFDYPSFVIKIDHISSAWVGKTICIDSAGFESSQNWLWETPFFDAQPMWDGPYCFEINDCCQGMRGNVEYTDNEINIADLTALVRDIFGTSKIDCLRLRNVDGDPAETVDILDLVYLIDYMFRGGPEPAACP